MDYTSHTKGGIAIGVGAICLSVKVGLEPGILPIMAGSVIGSLLPDIDHPKSFLGRWVRPISNILYGTVGHRTFTHSFLFIALIGFLVSHFDLWLGVGVAAGVFSHILLDMTSRAGVAFLYPFVKKRIKWF
ncbi:MAG: metal-dependent hydrolase [Niameybacter sp.]